MRLYLLILLLSVIISTSVEGQLRRQIPALNHYYINPFTQNPSFAAGNGFSELSLIHRQQWQGIEDAPVTTNLTFQLPLSSNLGLGVNILNDSEGAILTTTSFMVAGAYTVNFSPSAYLSFGLGVGISRNSIDTDEIDLNDPVWSGVLDKSVFIDGQFGVNLNLKKLNIAFALPNLFESDARSSSDFQDFGFAGLDATLTAVSYSLDFGPSVRFKPMFIYRTDELSENQFEANATIYLKDLVWVGGLYRQDYGAAGYLGFNISDLFKVGYSYDFASDQVSGFSDGSHEFYLSIRLSKKKEMVEEATEQEDEPVAYVDEITEEAVTEVDPEPEVVEETAPIAVVPVQEVVDEPEDPVVEEKDIFEEQSNEEEIKEIIKSEKIVTIQQGFDPNELSKGNYAVVGAFRVRSNAENYRKQIEQAGHEVEIGFSSKTNLNYVIVGHSQDLLEVRQMRDKYRAINKFQFPETWILRIY